jgi:hypothetical protein
MRGVAMANKIRTCLPIRKIFARKRKEKVQPVSIDTRPDRNQKQKRLKFFSSKYKLKVDNFYPKCE